MSILTNRFYTGEADPNLASGLDYRVREKLDEKHINHFQHANKLTYKPKFPYTEALVRQGGVPTAEQFFGIEKPSDAWVHDVLAKEGLLRQKKLIEERNYPLTSRADLERVYAAHFQQLFQKQLLDRDVQYNAMLLSDFRGSANDPERPELSEREAYLERERTRTRYLAEGTLMSAPSMRQYLAQQQAALQFFSGRQVPLTAVQQATMGMNAVDATNAGASATASSMTSLDTTPSTSSGATPELSVPSSGAATPLTGLPGSQLTAAQQAARALLGGSPSMPSAVAEALARDNASGSEMRSQRMRSLQVTSAQAEQIYDMMSRSETVSPDELARMAHDLQSQGINWRTYVDFVTGNTRMGDHMARRLDPSLLERSALTEAGVPLDPAARESTTEEGGYIHATEAGRQGAVMAPETEEDTRRAEEAREQAERDAIERLLATTETQTEREVGDVGSQTDVRQEEREGQRRQPPVPSSFGPESAARIGLYRSATIKEPNYNENGSHFYGVKPDGTLDKTRRYKLDAPTGQHKELYRRKMLTGRDGADISEFAWIPPYRG